MASTKPGRDSDQFALRLPDGMRDKIKASAEENGRSMNAEIVFALERYFAFQGIDISSEPFTRQATDKVLDDSEMIAKGLRAARRLLAQLEHAEEFAAAAIDTRKLLADRDKK